MLSACFTGHRKLSEAYYNPHNPTPEWRALQKHVNLIVNDLIINHNVNHFISGLAIGVDLLGAECVSLFNTLAKTPVKLTGAMPFPSQSNKWPQSSREHWNNVCKTCNEVVAVSEDPYHPSKMQIRNEWMVDRSNYILAIWDGTEKGGTWNCIKYAKSQGKPILHIKSSGIECSHAWLT